MRILTHDGTQREPNGFKPFVLTLVCETEEDLESLWHRFNVRSIANLSDYIRQGHPPQIQPNMDVWNEINNAASSRGMRRDVYITTDEDDYDDWEELDEEEEDWEEED